MIHNENHPEEPVRRVIPNREDPSEEELEIRRLAGTTELHEFVAELEARRERWENPPKWDLLTRWVNFTNRLVRAEVDQDPVALKWGPRLMLIRLAVCVALALSILYWHSLIGAALLGAPLMGWATENVMRRQSYTSGYIRGLMERR